MPKPGRPKKPKGERRVKQLHILLTDQEHRLIEAAAKADSSAGTSTWARGIVLNAAKGKVGG